MNTKKLLLTAGLFALAGVAQAVPTDVYKASLLVFTDIEAQEGRTTLIQISNFGSTDVHLQCYYQTADKAKGQFDFTMSPKETRVFDVKTGEGVPGSVGAQFPPFSTITGLPGYPQGELICFAVEGKDWNGDGVYSPINYDSPPMTTSPTGLVGVARVIQYYAPGWVTEYQAWAMMANAGDTVSWLPPIIANDDGSFTMTFGPLNGPTGNTYEACARSMIGQILTRNSAGDAGRGYAGLDTDYDTWVVGNPGAGDSGTMVVDANHLYVAICAQALQEGAPLLYTKLVFNGRDEDENSFQAWQCGDSWYDVNLGDPSADPWNTHWGPRFGWNNFLNIGERWAVSYQLNVDNRLAAYSTCKCGGVACPPILCADGTTRPYTFGCPATTGAYVPGYSQHPGTNTNSVGLWATQQVEAYLTPANDQDAAASNLFAWRNAAVNGFITVNLEAAKQ